MKSIRKDILTALSKHGEQTQDDLQTQLTDYDGRQLSNNLQAAKIDGLISSRRDDVTGRPAYKLTVAGKTRLNELQKKDASSGMDAQPAEASITGSQSSGEPPALPQTEGLAVAPVAKQSAPAADETPFQARVQPWLMACFGEMISGDREERNHRHLEESLELVQSCGCTSSEAHQLVDYVYSRPIGEPAQEVGGVMVTLAALCLANGLDMHEAGETELARIWTKVDQIRAKQAAKPKHSPLPAADENNAEVERLQQLVEAKQGSIDKLEGRLQRMFLQVEFIDGDGLEHKIGQVMHDRIHDQTKIDEQTNEIARLQAENLALKVLNESMPGFGAAYEAIQGNKPPFYVSVGLQIGAQVHKDIDVATRRAKHLVKRGDKVGFVLIPIRKAVRGVEIIEVKAA